MFPATGYPQPKSRPHSLNIVSTDVTSLYSKHVADNPSDQVAEAAVVGINDELSGQAVNAFVALKEGNETNDQVKKDLVMQVRKSIGPFAAPKAVFVVDDLPKTRSGKIMRRILRKILSGEEDSLGDTSTVSHAPLIAAFLLPSLCFWQTVFADCGCSSPTRVWWIKSSRLSWHPERSERIGTSMRRTRGKGCTPNASTEL